MLTGFTYNYPAGIPHSGVFDITPVTSYAAPTTAKAGPDQSLCGGTSATLHGNDPKPSFSGLWSKVSGNGGTVVTPGDSASTFTGVNGNTYKLNWTISSGTCTSSDTVVISFPLLAQQPAAFTAS